MIAFFALGVINAKAQSTEFKPFRVGVDFGYGIPSGDGAKGGVIFAIEPKYAINDKISLGLRMEGAVLLRASVDDQGFASSADAKASGSYLATGNYYFSTQNFRPFVGLGLGIHNLASASFDENNPDPNFEEVKSGTKFGATPTVGFEISHFRFAIDYNLVGKTEKINNNYIGVKLGFFLGGGRL